MEEFLRLLQQSLDEGSFASLILSKRRGTPDGQRAKRIAVRPVEVRGQRRWQWTGELARQVHHDNLDAEQLIDRVANVLGASYRHAHLFTSAADVSLRFDKSGRSRITTSPPTKTAPANTRHDRKKAYLIPEGRPCRFLEELDVMTADGRVHRSRQSKFRQINRFLEFVQDIIPHLPAAGPLEVIDFGCGLSYLTFALHHLLTAVHLRDVRMVGIDQNRQVIDRCMETCRRLGLKDLEFVAQPITALSENRKVHLAVALHACDTATDDALAQAVRRHADVILAAPCCQHELAPQLNGGALALLIQHGILRERLAAMATDALRAAVLEQCGYRSQIVEFIETEHTPKNLLLRAVRKDAHSPDPRQTDRITDLKVLLGIHRMRLENLL
ncbi:MAG: SAM-dependent methyltransferase [Planctomycetaceae bacterium]